MRALIQRVKNANVRIDEKIVGEIGRGLLVFHGVGREDVPEGVHQLADKIANLRIFENDAGRFDRSVLDVGGEILVVSQFTLYGDCRKGRRPSFSDAADPEEAEQLYERLIGAFRQKGIKTESGRFGARMDVALVNDGPVTIWMDIPPNGEKTSARKEP